jgi:hypothetical protein
MGVHSALYLQTMKGLSMNEVDGAKPDAGLDGASGEGKAFQSFKTGKTTDLARWLLEEKWFAHYRWKWIALGALASCPLYGLAVLGIAWCLDGKALADIGAIGDSFGILNTLFSGLALFGVIVTIAMQSRELELQRDELEQLTLESKRTADAQEGIQRLQLEETQRANNIASDKAQPIFECRRVEYYDGKQRIGDERCHKGMFNPEGKPCSFMAKIWLRNIGQPISEIEVISEEWETPQVLAVDEYSRCGVLNPGELFVIRLDLMMDGPATQFSNRLFQLSYLNPHQDRFLMMGYIKESPMGAGLNWVGIPICITRRYESGAHSESPS